jgi:hypothetical protein
MAKNDYRTELRKLADQLRDPMRLRIVVCIAALAVAYFGIYGPLDGQISVASRKLNETEGRGATAQDIEFLKAQEAMFRERLGPAADANECVQYVLDGIRALPVKLERFDSDSTVAVGPYEAVSVRVEVRGEPAHLDSMLDWLETNERLFRIDSINLEPPRGDAEQPVARLTLLALKVKP